MTTPPPVLSSWSWLEPFNPEPSPFPPVDEHWVDPEVTRDEIIGGRRVVAMPAAEVLAE